MNSSMSSSSSPAARSSSRISSSRDLDPELVGDRLEHELARDRHRRLRAQPLLELLGRLAGHLQIGVGVDASLLQAAGEPVQQLARAELDERAGRR